MQSLENFKRMNSSELRGFVTGLILGDGWIDKGVHKRAFCIKSTDENFIKYIEKCIKETTNFKVQVTKTEEHYSSGCNHKTSWELRVVAHPYFNKLYHYFYDDIRHRKIYSKTLSWLNPRGLANWYMSDGYVCLVGKNRGFVRSRRIDICTDRYYLEDIELMKNYLKNKFNLDTSIIKRNNTYRLRVQVTSYETFINLISPYIIPSMRYKLYLGYESKQDWMSNEFWELQKSLMSATTLTDNAEG